jgi:hypothetical protein
MDRKALKAENINADYKPKVPQMDLEDIVIPKSDNVQTPEDTPTTGVNKEKPVRDVRYRGWRTRAHCISASCRCEEPRKKNYEKRAADNRPSSMRECCQQRLRLRRRAGRSIKAILSAVAAAIPGARLAPSAPAPVIGPLVVGISGFLVLANAVQMFFTCVIGIKELLARGYGRPVVFARVVLGC